METKTGERTFMEFGRIMLPLSSARRVLSHYRKRLRKMVLVGPSLVGCDYVSFLGKGRLYVSTEDNRGLAVLRSAGVTQPYITWLWHQVSKRIVPDLYMDIGSNYGEIAFSKKYSNNERVFLAEPNLEVARSLRKSLQTRADRQSFTLWTEFLGREAEDIEFVLDRKWSGTSSAYYPVTDAPFKGGGEQRTVKVNVRARSLDQLIADADVDCNGAAALFKIDVEGGEVGVLEGAAGVLERLSRYVIIVEAHVGRENDAAQVLERFGTWGEVYHMPPGRPALLTTPRSIGGREDLLIVSDSSTAGVFRDLVRPRWM